MLLVRIIKNLVCVRACVRVCACVCVCVAMLSAASVTFFIHIRRKLNVAAPGCGCFPYKYRDI